MTRIQRLMRLHRLHAPAGDGGSDTGGSSAAPVAAAPVAAPVAAPAPVAAAPAAPAAAPAPAAGDTLLTAGEPTEADAEAAAKAEADAKAAQEAADKKASGAPAEYADFTVPEGVSLDAESTTEFKTLAKDMNLSQEQAQRLVDFESQRAQKASGLTAEVVAKAKTEWTEQSKADKEFGGDAFASNLAFARKAMDAFGTDELKSVLNASGIGNHPEVVRFMYRAGKAISEDGFVSGRQGAPAKGDSASRLYPTTSKAS